MLRLRRWHSYLSIFFAPAILFFAFSGLLQVLGLHESRGNETYHPPAWIVTIASLHKDQVLPKRHDEHEDHDAGPQAGPPKGEPHHHHDDDDEAFVPLKPFAIAVALGLIATALLGIAIALQNLSMRRTSLILLLVGTAIPLILIIA
ncbi:MAG: hypothetical protein WDM89_17800 [Rhizomicrobium sp.]